MEQLPRVIQEQTTLKSKYRLIIFFLAVAIAFFLLGIFVTTLIMFFYIEDLTTRLIQKFVTEEEIGILVSQCVSRGGLWRI